jgi:DNA-directed RNA polymerase subunit RPC12/RpoP
MNEPKQLKSLAQHNKERTDAYMQQPPNGIACPTCGQELVDSRPTGMLLSLPPQKEVHCPACGWRGFRLA